MGDEEVIEAAVGLTCLRWPGKDNSGAQHEVKELELMTCRGKSSYTVGRFLGISALALKAMCTAVDDWTGLRHT
jgi:hypothetical protein